MMNIFDMDYTREEIKFMGLPKDTDLTVGDARVHVREFPGGRLDAYLNVEWLVETLEIPTYYKNGSTWMSVTPMEVQSMWVAIERAKLSETVAVGGLGLGYCVLRMCEPDNGGVTESITVYEQSQNCIDIFKSLHENRPGFDKLLFVCGDIREECVGKSYDFMFNDIYQSTGQDEILDDIEFFLTNNDIREYRYWGQELMSMLAVEHEDFEQEGHPEWMRDHTILTWEDSSLFEMHKNSEGSNLRFAFNDEEFAFACVQQHLEYQQEAA
jgi:hypothetical protein